MNDTFNLVLARAAFGLVVYLLFQDAFILIGLFLILASVALVVFIGYIGSIEARLERDETLFIGTKPTEI